MKVAPRLGLVVAALAMGLVYAVTPITHGRLIATINNNSDNAASAVFPCTKAAADVGTAQFIWPLDDAPASTGARDALNNNGRPGTYQGTVTFNATGGPCAKDGAGSISLAPGFLNLSPGYVASTSAALAGPQEFSVSIWFKYNSSSGGRLMGFGSSQQNSSTTTDRHLYLSNNGNLYFGVTPGGTKTTIVSPLRYNDNGWHHAVGSLAPSGSANPGMRLYVDGALVASQPATTTTQAYNGFWRAGFDQLNNWTAGPTSDAITGSLAYASVFSSALTPAQVQVLYNARL